MRTCSPDIRPLRGASRSPRGRLSARLHERRRRTGPARGHPLGAVGLIVAMALVCRPAACQDPIAIGEPRPSLDLRGQVLLDGGGMPGVAVSIRRAGGSEARTAVTDQDGRFRLRDLAPGTYSVTASAAGFATLSRQVSIMPGSTANVVLAFGGAGSGPRADLADSDPRAGVAGSGSPAVVSGSNPRADLQGRDEHSDACTHPAFRRRRGLGEGRDERPGPSAVAVRESDRRAST